MIRKRFGEKWGSSRGRYIRSTSDIPLNWEDMRNIADIQELCEIVPPSEHNIFKVEDIYNTN